MGADLIVVAHAAPIDRNGAPLCTVTDEVRAEVERRIRSIAPTEAAVAAELYDEYVYSLNEDDALSDRQVIAAMVDKVCEYIQYWQVSRDSSWDHIAGRLIVITGGTSWGDDPSEYWDAAAFSKVYNLFDEPFNVEVSS